MLYKLWEDGLLDSLDDPLEKYLDGFTIKNPLGGARSGSSGLTLRRMASQLSGNRPFTSPTSSRNTSKDAELSRSNVR